MKRICLKILLPSFIEEVILYAISDQIEEQEGQRRYEMRKKTNVVIMFTSDSKKRKYEKA